MERQFLRGLALTGCFVFFADGSGAAVVRDVGNEAVPVYLEDSAVVPGPVLFRAKALATKMFAGAGVQLQWHSCRAPECESLRDGSIVIDFVTGTDGQVFPGALAFARAIEGVHISVFYDRVRSARAGLSPAQVGQVLAHVLVHEITHILQGVSRHSDSGIMKANWSGKDYLAMLWEPLSFTPGDLVLIRAGLALRASRAKARSATLGIETN